MTYEMPTTVNWSEGLPAGLEYVNEITSGLFSTLTLVTLFAIVMAGAYAAKRDILMAGTIASFATWSVALMLWIGNMANNTVLVFCTAVMIICVAVLFFTKRDEGL